MADMFFSGWRRIGAIIAIVIVLGAPAALAYKAWHDSTSNPVVQIKISGYDPRDMLRGHYLLFQFDWNWAGAQPNEEACPNGNCCLCLDNEAVEPRASLMACEDAQPAVCPIKLQGYYAGEGRYDIGLAQYYVPERRARELEILLRDPAHLFHMGLSLRPNGTAVLEKLYYQGMSIENYLRTHPVIDTEIEQGSTEIMAE